MKKTLLLTLLVVLGTLGLLFLLFYIFVVLPDDFSRGEPEAWLQKTELFQRAFAFLF